MYNIYLYNMRNIHIKLTTDKTTTAGNNYKELHDCKWDPMTLRSNTLYTVEFKV